MNRNRIIVFVVSIVAGVGLLAFRPSLDRRLGEVESLLADADEVLASRQAVIFSIPGIPDEVETEIQIYRMSYLAVIKELRTKRTTVIILGPLLILLGLAGLIRYLAVALLGGPRERRKPRTRPPPRRRSAPKPGPGPARKPVPRRR